MNRTKRRLRLPAAAATVLLGIGLTAGCGTARGGAAGAQASAPGAVISQEDASAVVSRYDDANNQVNTALDSTGLTGIETAPLLTADVAWMRISKQLNQTVAPITDKGVTVYAASGAAYPHWFLAVSSRAQGGVPYPGPSYRVFVQDGPGAPYRAAYSLNVTGTVPKIAVGSPGAATAVSSPDGLLVSPDSLGAHILDHYEKNLVGKDMFSYSAPLDDNLSNGYALGQKYLSGQGTTLSRALGQTPPSTYALRTSDGGVLAFTTDVVTDTLTPVKAGGTVSLAAKGTDAAQLGKPAGATASQFAISRLETFLTYVPTSASGSKAQVIGYNEVPINVS
ncbi:hypothetical protein P3T37_000280 [Kitasatospora sp. MAA4]|uniref:hypothetical protein n=1 Tax=Kitasatospora sp. MAA4 TaxID=3035093 RepID=UPI002476BA9A|nr:hypothetical protein [Kitasatospora sp. MAA4]MDH6130913.1 hypothetical protein [Kitasatospora sp. MAA4]